MSLCTGAHATGESSPESDRLAALRHYRAGVPDARDALDRLVRLAAHLFDVSTAKVNLVGRDREWTLSVVGDAPQTRPRRESFCAHTIQSDGVTLAEDASADSRFSSLPQVTGPPEYHFYAGVPLTVPGGHRIGTLCVLDRSPHTPSEEALRRLEDLAALVVDELEARRVRPRPSRERDGRAPLLRPIADHLSDGVFRATPAEGVIFANQAYADLFGYDCVAEVLGADASAAGLAPDGLSSLWDRIDESDTLDGIELELRRRDGSTFTGRIHGTVYRDEADAVQFVVGTVREIPAQTGTERELRITKRLLEKTFASLNEAVLVVDASTREIVTCNAAVEDIFGYTPEELIGTSTEALHVDRPSFERFAEMGDPVLEKEGAFSCEYRMRRKDGRVIDTEHRVTLLEDEEGFRGGVSVVRDITEQKQRRRRLVAAKEAAEKAARLKSAMLANMSHEVRTPLTSMIGFSQHLRDELEGDLAEQAGIIYESGRRLQRTLETVIELSRLESGTYEPEWASISLDRMARRVADEFRPHAEANDLTLDVERSQPPVFADADEHALRKILGHLLDNAIKFTPGGGRVVLRTRPEVGETVIVEVEDTGIGIAEAALSEVFEPFKQESEGLSREYEGTGLGLSVVRELTVALGGMVDVETQKGRGTRIIVRLPQAAPNDETGPGEQDSSATPPT